MSITCQHGIFLKTNRPETQMNHWTQEQLAQLERYRSVELFSSHVAHIPYYGSSTSASSLSPPLPQNPFADKYISQTKPHKTRLYLSYQDVHFIRPSPTSQVSVSFINFRFTIVCYQHCKTWILKSTDSYYGLPLVDELVLKNGGKSL